MNKTLLAKGVMWSISMQVQDAQDVVAGKTRNLFTSRECNSDTDSIASEKSREADRARAKRRLQNLIQQSLRG